MKATLRRRLDAAGRVRDFLRAHKTDAVEEGLGLAKLEELIQRAEQLDAQQRAGLVTTRSASQHRKTLRRALTSKLLFYLRALGALELEGTGMAVQFEVPPSNASQQALLTAAQAMLEKATAEKDVLLARGMSPTLLGDIAAVLGEFEQTIAASRAARRDHVGASTDLQAVFAEIRKQVRALDGMVRYRFGDEPELMGAWRSARNVLGPFKTKDAPEQTPKAA